jgi:hypothetical protein
LSPLTENQSVANRREKVAAYHRERYANDPEFRERVLARRRDLYRQQMQDDPEAVRSAARERARKRRARLKDDPEYRASIKKHRDVARRKAKDFVLSLKADTPCADCGQVFDPVCMDFDHIRGEKNDNVGSMVARGVSVERIRDEVDKCELVCANCHRVRTADRLSNEGIDIHEVMI